MRKYGRLPTIAGPGGYDGVKHDGIEEDALEWRFETAADIYASTMHAEIMALLHAEGAHDGDFDAAELIYGELITNAIRYARGRIAVRLEWGEEFAILRVVDAERYTAPPIRLPTDPFAESGRGLYIVKALAKDFAIDGESAGSVAHATLPVRRRGFA